MSFEQCDSVMDKFFFLQLKNDKDSADVVFLEEPRPRETRGFRNGTRTVACFPVATTEGLKVLTRGYQDKNRLKEAWEDLQGKVVRITRHGQPGDPNTTYEYRPRKMTKEFKAILDGITQDDIEEMFTSIKGVIED